MLLAVLTKCRPPRCQNKYFSLRLGDYLITFPSKAQCSLSVWSHDNTFLCHCRQHESEIVSSGVVTSLTLSLLLHWLFILFITNIFPCLCTSSRFAHFSSVLVEGHSSASVMRESLRLLFFLEISMHLHFIKQSEYPKLFELTWISKLPWSCNLFSERKSAGMGRFCNCQELVQSKNGLF